MNAIAALIIGYLIGGIPFGLIISRLVKGVDPRTTGSGSSGATNVSRVLGKGWGILVLILDAAKGYLPVKFLAPLLMNENVLLGSLLLGVGAVIGHVWTPYAGFRGGKGVATGGGVLAAVSFPSLVPSLGCWIGVFIAIRVVSAASIAAAICFPIGAALTKQPKEIVIAGVLIAGLIIWTHRENIRRVRSGQEKKLL